MQAHPQHQRQGSELCSRSSCDCWCRAPVPRSKLCARGRPGHSNVPSSFFVWPPLSSERALACDCAIVFSRGVESPPQGGQRLTLRKRNDSWQEDTPGASGHIVNRISPGQSPRSADGPGPDLAVQWGDGRQRGPRYDYCRREMSWHSPGPKPVAATSSRPDPGALELPVCSQI